MAASLRARMSAGEIGMQRAVGTARAAAQTVVVEFDDVGERHRGRGARPGAARCTWRRWHGILHRDATRGPAWCREDVESRREPLVDVEHACAEAGGARRCRADGRSPSAWRRNRRSRRRSVRRRGARAWSRVAARLASSSRPACIASAPQHAAALPDGTRRENRPPRARVAPRRGRRAATRP